MAENKDSLNMQLLFPPLDLHRFQELCLSFGNHHEPWTTGGGTVMLPTILFAAYIW